MPRVARHWSQPGVQPDVARYINHGGCPNAYTKVVMAGTVKHACHHAAARVLDATKRSRELKARRPATAGSLSAAAALSVQDPRPLAVPLGVLTPRAGRRRHRLAAH